MRRQDRPGRSSRRALLVLAALLALALPGRALAAATPAPIALGPGTRAAALTAGPDGNLWFAGVQYAADGFRNVVGRVTPTGQVTEFPLAVKESGELGLAAIVAGPEGQLWFSETGANRIGRIGVDGRITQFNLQTPGSRPSAMATDSAGHVWVAEEGIGRVARIDPAAQTVAEFGLNPNGSPSGVAIGPEGSAWVTERASGELARVDPNGTVGHFRLPNPSGLPDGIATGPEGKLWISEEGAPELVQVTPADGNAETASWGIAGGLGTALITRGPSGDLWFRTGERIGSISPKGIRGGRACVDRDCKTPISALATGPEGALWYASGASETSAGQLEVGTAGTIGRFAPPPPRARIRRDATVVSGHRVWLSVSCRGGVAAGECAGLARLTALGAARASTGSLLAHGRFRCGVDFACRVGLILNAAARRLLAAGRRLPARLSVTVAGGSGDSARLLLHRRHR